MLRPVHSFLLAATLTLAAQSGPALPRPGPRDLCPVCGMLVAKYPNWLATVVWKDGQVHHFDGAKDLFKFLQAPASFVPGRSRAGLQGAYVTEYYGLTRIAAEGARFVVGSDVLGPMGHELVPLASAEDAADFLKDHHGKRVLRFAEVTPQLTKDVDSGRF